MPSFRGSWTAMTIWVWETGDEQAQALEHDFTNVLRGVYNARRLLASGITTPCVQSARRTTWMYTGVTPSMPAGCRAPRLVICGKFIMRTGGHAWYLGREADGPEQIRTAVREQIKQGADAIKIMITGGASTPGSVPTISDYTVEEIAAAVEEAHRFGRKIGRPRSRRGWSPGGHQRRHRFDRTRGLSHGRGPCPDGKKGNLSLPDLWRLRSRGDLGGDSGIHEGELFQGGQALFVDFGQRPQAWRKSRVWWRHPSCQAA